MPPYSSLTIILALTINSISWTHYYVRRGSTTLLANDCIITLSYICGLNLISPSHFLPILKKIILLLSDFFFFCFCGQTHLIFLCSLHCFLLFPYWLDERASYLTVFYFQFNSWKNYDKILSQRYHAYIKHCVS